jgi:hypothetical protein
LDGGGSYRGLKKKGGEYYASKHGVERKTTSAQGRVAMKELGWVDAKRDGWTREEGEGAKIPTTQPSDQRS